ncbi:hypothetical protein SAMN04515667_0601 [Formosa sp. Hel1_31_208]|uniref:hypothetical protein n=1 Tax=Formosa sp. Hel1_31_208 TaxID=1798225 RepID=UPI00087D4725|nr:hypothetical protein [Formosa sp. Hel1_31_208]SDR76780.1 hypothetical protein SAMN04515667_0601 [Formosa sp. Hel1_31_208]
MKKIFLVCFLTFSLLSCSVDDETPNFYYEILPIETVDIPDSFVFGSVNEISVSYFRPTGCHVFNNFYYEINENERTVAVVTAVFQEQSCDTFEPESEEVVVSFNFQVTSTDTYTFRFWQGEDDNGNDTYYIVEVPVTE